MAIYEANMISLKHTFFNLDSNNFVQAVSLS